VMQQGWRAREADVARVAETPHHVISAQPSSRSRWSCEDAAICLFFASQAPREPRTLSDHLGSRA
jgi:hypothetical protein